MTLPESLCNPGGVDLSDVRPQTCLIVTRGRLTGAEHTVRVWFAVIGECLYAAVRGGLRSDWLQNALHAGSLEVRVSGKAWRGVPSLVPPEEMEPVIEAFAEKYHRHPTIIGAWREEPPVVLRADPSPGPAEQG